MYQSIHFNGKNLLVKQEEYLKKHNIVYQAPAYKGYDGLPIGNGDLGGMLYHTPSAIVLSLNKTDVIDYRKDGDFDAWSWESEECNTAPVSCGMIQITDTMPSFDWIYLNQYKETLSLSEGCIECESKTPFSEYKYCSYVSKTNQAAVFEIEASSVDEVERKVSIEKWSSPNFFHYYEQLKPFQDKNLFTAKSGIEGSTAYIEQQLNGTHYILGMRVTGCKHRIELPNKRTAEFVLEKSTKQTFRVFATVLTSHTGKVKIEEVLQVLDKAEEEQDSLHQKQKDAWAAFWQKSFICLPDDDYLENIYYMNLYQLNSCSLGSQPVTFAGLWSWYKDSRNWGHFYHWNHQQTYWGVDTSNHGELMQNYLEYRFNMLDHAKEDGKQLFGGEGAFYSDITNFNGYNALEPDTVRNLTVGPQIAMDFYRHYQYTLDKKFLREHAFPVMKAAADLYMTVLQLEEDSVYRVKGGSTSYESYWNLKETASDCTMIQVLFQALIDSAKETGLLKEEIEKYQHIQAHLYSLPCIHVEHDGRDLEIISAGRKWNGEPIGYTQGDYPLSTMPASELIALYPSGYIGLSQKGTKAFEAARNTARVIFDDDVYHTSKIGTSGHAVVSQIAARLGMREDCREILNTFVKKYQVFPNGLTHFADIKRGQFWEDNFKVRVLEHNVPGTNFEMVHEKSDGLRTIIPSDDFLHCYFESASNIMTGTNEMLLQSYDGIIRVFPATPVGYTALFTLLATGGFLVTSELVRGEVRFISIQSIHGGNCSVELPWDSGKEALHNEISILSDRNEIEFDVVKHMEKSYTIEFKTKKSASYLITRREYPLEQYYQDPIEAKENHAPKKWDTNIIGKFSYTEGRTI